MSSIIGKDAKELERAKLAGGTRSPLEGVSFIEGARSPWEEICLFGSATGETSTRLCVSSRLSSWSKLEVWCTSTTATTTSTSYLEGD